MVSLFKPKGKSSPPAAQPASRSAPIERHSVEHWVQSYGDLVFDLCESVLWDSEAAQIAFRATLRDLKLDASHNRYERHERAWVLRLACARIRDLSRDHGRKVTASEQLQLDAAEGVSIRLKQFDHYFHRLPVDDQLLLLLRDKFGLSYGEIAAAMAVPEGSLKIRRQQALRALEEWLWSNS